MPEEVKGASITLKQQCRRGEEVLVRGAVCASRSTRRGRARPIPKPLRIAMKADQAQVGVASHPGRTAAAHRVKAGRTGIHPSTGSACRPIGPGSRSRAAATTPGVTPPCCAPAPRYRARALPLHARAMLGRLRMRRDRPSRQAISTRSIGTARVQFSTVQRYASATLKFEQEFAAGEIFLEDSRNASRRGSPRRPLRPAAPCVEQRNEDPLCSSVPIKHSHCSRRRARSIPLVGAGSVRSASSVASVD